MNEAVEVERVRPVGQSFGGFVADLDESIEMQGARDASELTGDPRRNVSKPIDFNIPYVACQRCGGLL
jgi:hypothetical protein